jgi:hypothetical protein
VIRGYFFHPHYIGTMKNISPLNFYEQEKYEMSSSSSIINEGSTA